MARFRLGTTSYVYPADIITNARRLAGRTDDIELVVFESDEHGNNLNNRVVQELRQLGLEHNMTYTVHLPLDLGLAEDDPKLSSALRVIAITAILVPHAYIVHLDGHAVPGSRKFSQWLRNSLDSLHALVKETGSPDLICVENLENQAPEMLEAVLAEIPVAACLDIGHLWKQDLNPQPFLEKWLYRTRVVHLHGVGDRDHQRLSLMTDKKLDPVVKLLNASFEGVVTFEIFDEYDLLDSMDTFASSLGRTLTYIPDQDLTNLLLSEDKA